jgi:hypothetical protein
MASAAPAWSRAAACADCRTGLARSEERSRCAAIPARVHGYARAFRFLPRAPRLMTRAAPGVFEARRIQRGRPAATAERRATVGAGRHPSRVGTGVGVSARSSCDIAVGIRIVPSSQSRPRRAHVVARREAALSTAATLVSLRQPASFPWRDPGVDGEDEAIPHLSRGVAAPAGRVNPSAGSMEALMGLDRDHWEAAQRPHAPRQGAL